ncbi:histidine kinase [Maribacter polysiphoniae]|uniref:Histidine kinase n=1 Tax=Maribacter polysiphoniae TaxID=429344 RepID=A0A316E3W0_9FLAO|nr:histidine kinase [Maribacter polysiphoniae]MBD1260527.1 histidine kinase [Maribacter polysiphoniae]PWK24348.1 histidine kinase [Maribacter polysiphoniae]
MQLQLNSLKKYQAIIIHLLVWGFIFALPYIFSLQWDGDRVPTEFARKILVLNIVMNIIWVATFYLNMLFFIPRLLYRKNILIYLAVNLGLLIGILLINRLVYDALGFDFPYSLNTALWHNALPFLFFVLIAIAYKTVSDRLKMDRKSKERESENLKTELAFLRSQISPHFLFNVLNNMVALVRMKSDKLEPTILKLSSLMQYMLYDTDDEKVLLKSEVDYLRSYIDLQQLRFGDRLRLNVDLNLKEDWHAIEPMLLIPFVENAFKHGTGMVEAPTITISLQAINGMLIFSVRNKYIDNDQAKDKVSGIGLANIKRRLELLYAGNHDLDIEKSDEWYSITLKLKLVS